MAKAIQLKPVTQTFPTGTVAAFEIILEGFEACDIVTVEVWEIDENNETMVHGERMLGTITGEVLQSSSPNHQYLINTTATGTSGNSPNFGITTDQTVASKQFYFELPVTDADDKWSITIRPELDPSVQSNTRYIQRNARNVPPAQATYRWHGQNRVVAFYNDGSTNATGSGGYFHDLVTAIAEARHFIFIADWSFHPYMIFNRPAHQTIGAALVQWANSHRSGNNNDQNGIVAIHTWDHTNIAAADNQNDSGEAIFDNEITKPGNMFWRMSSRTGENGSAGFGWSHHQKFVVMDCPCPTDPNSRRTIKAFLGGLDLTQGRFDWPEHHILPEDADLAFHCRVTNTGRTVHDWYNCEFPTPPLTGNGSAVLGDNNRTNPRQPWHDIHCQIMGPAAWDVVREFVGRWSIDPAWHPNEAEGDTNDACISTVQNKFSRTLFDRTRFIQQWERHPWNELWQAQIIRSITSDHWRTKDPVNTTALHPEFRWSITNHDRERSIQDMYLRMIAAARNFIYIETQYFIGSGDRWPNGTRTGVRNRIPGAIADKIVEKIQKNEPFHVYLILPYFPEGDPASGANKAQRDFQWNSIAVIIRAIEQLQPAGSWRRYITVGFLAQWSHLANAPVATGSRIERVRANRRYMIYVHSKMMIVDDRAIIIGSANLNERSLAGGRDSEIGIGLWPEMTKGNDCRTMIRDLRRRLFTEHFGALPAHWENPHHDECRQEIQLLGRNNWELFNFGWHTFQSIVKRGHFCTWPVNSSQNGLGLRGNNSFVIADGWEGHVTQSDWDDWFVWPTRYTGLGDIPE